VFKVTAAAPATISLGIVPPSLAFQTPVNGQAPTQSVTVSNSGGGTLNWTASANQPWITLSATSGTAPSTLVVGMNTVGLAAGSYSGTITVSATGATNNPQTAGVSLTVLPFASGLVKVSGDSQSGAIGTALTQPLVVQATAGDGSPAAGITVRFTLAGQPAGAAGVSLSVSTATTDSAGQAQVTLTLGNQPGTYKVEVVAAGLTYQTVVFSVTATAAVGLLSATATTVTALPSNIAADGSSRAVVTVIPRDGSGYNLGPGQTVTLSKTGGGTLSAVTDKGDGSYVATLMAPATAGSAAVSATVSGTAVQQTIAVSFSSGVVPILVTAANLSSAAFQITIDSSDNVYAAYGNGISRIDGLTGAVSPVSGLAGVGAGAVEGVGVDRLGNLYYARLSIYDARVFKKDLLSGVNATVAGTGVLGAGLDEGPATLAALFGGATYRLAVNKAGNVYMEESAKHRIRRVEAATGLMSTTAGTGTAGYGGDGGPARQALLGPTYNLSLALDEAGNLYIADRGNQRIRKVDAATGTITTVAGSRTAGFSGDGGSATVATLNEPAGVAVDRWGNLYIADMLNGRVRKVDATTGIITTVAGGGTGGSGSPATSASITPWDVAIDSSGTLYIVSGSTVFKVPGLNGDVSNGLRFLLGLVSGNNQSASVRTALAKPLAVKVNDTNGNPVAGQAVTFAITGQPAKATGAGLSLASATTGADGLATTSLTLGNLVGAYSVTATAMAGLSVTFTETATAGLATTLALAGGNSQSAPVQTTLAAPLAVKATDQYGNTVTGTVVSFTITGAPAGATGTLLGSGPVATDSAGMASATLKVGNQPGAYQVTATAAGLQPAGGIVFSETATSAATTNPYDGYWTGSTLQTGQTPQPLALIVRDNAVRAYSIQFVIPKCGQTITLTTNVASFALSGSTFSFVDFFSPGNLQRLEVAGTFTSAATASGTFTVSDATCNGEASGTWTAAAPAAGSQIQILSGNNQEGKVNKPLTEPLVVKVIDTSGSPVAGATVKFALASAPTNAQNAALSIANATTDSSGQAQTSLTLGTQQGTYLVTASLQGGAQVIFTATARPDIPAKVIKKSGDMQNALPGSVLPVPICVTVTDTFNNAVPDLGVSFAITVQPSGATGASLSLMAAKTGSDGTACTRMTGGNQLGSYLEETGFPGSGLSPVTFTVSVGAPSTILRASGDLQSGAPGATLGQPLVVQAMDGTGKPIAGVDVSFNISATPQGATGTALEMTTCRTDATGQCGTRLTLGSVQGVYTVTALASDTTGKPLIGSPLQFQALTATPTTLSKVSGDNQYGSVGKALGRALTAKVTDADGKPVGGVAVNFAVSGSPAGATGMAAAPATATTDANGLAQATLTLGSALGAYTVTATAANPGGAALTGSPASFTATAVQATQLAAVSGDGQTGTTMQPLAAPLVVRATDAAGNRVAGVDMSWAVTQAPAGATDFAVLPATCTTDADGVCGVTLFAGSQPGSYTAVATSAGLNPTSGVQFTATAQLGSGNPGAYDGNWAGTTAQAGTTPRPVGFTVRNSTITAYSIEFLLPQCGISVALWNNAASVALVNNQFSLTEQFGVAKKITLTLAGSFTSATQASGTFSVSDTSCGGTASGTWMASAPQATSHIRIASGNGQTGTVTQAVAAPLVVQVIDASGSPQANQAVTFALTSQPVGASGAALSAASALTDANGQASVNLTLGTVQGIYVVTATGPASEQVTLLATAKPDVPAKTIKRSGDNQTVQPGSVLPVPICVTVTDAYNNAIPDLAVSFSIRSQPSGGNATLSLTAASTATNGAACTQMSGGNQLGSYLEETGFPGTDLLPVTFQVLVSQPAVLEKAGGDNQSAQIGTTLANPLLVRVKDASGNAVAGVAVAFALSGQPAGAAGASVSPASCTTDVNGQCQAALTLGSAAGAYTVSATASDASGNALTGSPVTFTASALAGTAVSISAVSGTGQSATVGAQLANPFVVKVTDAAGNGVAGITVTFAVTAGGGTLSATSVTTDASGQASTKLTLGTAAGSNNNTVTATAAGLSGSPVTFTASANAGAAATIAAVSGSGQSGAVGTELASAFVVKVTDANGNGVSGVTVVFAVTAGGGTLSAASVATDASGQASTKLTLGTVAGSNNNTVTATAAGLSGSPVTFTASATALAANAYVVGDTSPFGADPHANLLREEVGEFGDHQLTILDLIYALRAVTSIPGYRPRACSDRFDAMDAFPKDTETVRGGDGILNTVDLIYTLRRVTNVDTSRPVRTSRGLACPAMAPPPPALMANATAALAAGTLELGPATVLEGVQRIPVYVHARQPLTLAGLSVSFQLDSPTDRERLRFVRGEADAPSLLDDGVPGMLALAWLQALTVPADRSLLLGWVEYASREAAAGLLAAEIRVHSIDAIGLNLAPLMISSPERLLK
jgi:adhesin/invasin